jgi:hypothetical protein
MKKVIILLTLCTIFLSCKSQSKVVKPIFLSKSEAADRIATEDKDGFFNKISLLEIQLTLNDSTITDKKVGLEKYKTFLKNEVIEFSNDEKQFLDSVFYIAVTMIATINPKLTSQSIELIKINTNHYGPSVYYTRNNAIFYPANVLKEKIFKRELEVTLHEIWHIISRNNPSLRAATYDLIGFKKINSIRLDDKLAQRTITNPDGSFVDYVIDLDGIDAAPIITSKYSKRNPEIQSLIEYINFDLYPVENGIVKPNPVIDAEKMNNFFKKIGDNTGYIIHPDEIIADNFSFAIRSAYENKYNQFSPEGKQLIDKLIAILKAY